MRGDGEGLKLGQISIFQTEFQQSLDFSPLFILSPMFYITELQERFKLASVPWQKKLKAMGLKTLRILLSSADIQGF